MSGREPEEPGALEEEIRQFAAMLNAPDPSTAAVQAFLEISAMLQRAVAAVREQGWTEEEARRIVLTAWAQWSGTLR